MRIKFSDNPEKLIIINFKFKITLKIVMSN